jgi:hypothetical protein
MLSHNHLLDPDLIKDTSSKEDRLTWRSMVCLIVSACLLSAPLNAWGETSVESTSQLSPPTTAPAEMNKMAHEAPPQLKLSEGWSLSGVLGLSSCMPSGEADCDQTYPGVAIGLSTEYRWGYIGITLDTDWSTLTPSGTGSDHVKHRISHVGLGVRGYLPLTSEIAMYSGLSLGPGWVDVSDDASESSISWSTFWSDLRLDLGALKALNESWVLEGALSLLLHFEGSRCALFQGAGPCALVIDLPTAQQDSAHLLMLRAGMRWTP